MVKVFSILIIILFTLSIVFCKTQAIQEEKKAEDITKESIEEEGTLRDRKNIVLSI